jgi:outer membrane protein assembly factor BamE (lipoprotein component of BamABCDE complex)
MRFLNFASSIVAIMTVIASSSCSAQQESHVQRTISTPDSLSMTLSTKPDEAKIRANWSKLKRGLAFKQVEAYLGRPTKIASSVYDDSTTWYYGTRVVVFDNIKRAVRYWREKE